MLVTRQNFPVALSMLQEARVLSFDTETTGLRPHHGDRLFCFVIAYDEERVLYFNFQPYPTFVRDGVCDESAWLGEEHIAQLQERIFSDPVKTWAMHNAKYDLHIAQNDGITFAGTVHCTMAQMRVVRNDLNSYSLDSCGQYAGLAVQKSSAVKEYCDANGCYEDVLDENTGRRKKHYKYHMVPLEIMQPYAEADALMTRALCIWQVAQVTAADATRTRGLKPMAQVAHNERALTKTVFGMERTGVLVDLAYCRQAVDSQKPRAGAITAHLSELCGRPFVDSGKFLGEVFAERGIKLPLTEKNKPSVAEAVISQIDDPIAREVLKLRALNKSVKTYFSNYLSMADPWHGRIHCDLVPSGTQTGRFSCRDPNLQNLTKADEDDEGAPVEEFNVRDAFIPTPGFCFFAPDYSQMEYRMMLDYAEEMAVIEQILQGVDVHQATANLAGFTRREAKTFNFAYLYGAGDGNLAAQLRKTIEEAKRIRAHFRSMLPRVAGFVDAVKERAASAGYVTNWFGRRCYFANPRESYAAPNHLIQGGTADVVKRAMVDIGGLLEGKRSRMLLCIHDEIIVELHESELELAQEICRIMETTYPHKHLPLQVEPSYSWTSLGRKVKGLPETKAS